MPQFRCDNFDQGCPFADGNAHEAESLDEFRLHRCEVLANGEQCGAYDADSPSKGSSSEGKRLALSPRGKLAMLVLAVLLLVGSAGYGLYAWLLKGPSCEIADARKLLTLDPKVGELEEMGSDCLDAGMNEADADKIVTGTIALRAALEHKSPEAAWLLGRLFDPLKRPELEEQSEVPTLLPAADPREALRFYDLAGKEHEEAATAAAALRAKYPELGLTAAGKSGAPLDMPGHQGLMQRVLSKPGAQMFAQPGASGQGSEVSPFSLYYVFESRPGWLRVGDSLGRGAIGWMRAEQAEAWNVMLVMRYAPPDNRQPALFFRDELTAKSLLTQPGAAEQITALIVSAKGANPDPRLAAVEDRFVNWSATPYFMPILKTSPIVTDSGRKVYLAQVASISGRSAAPSGATGGGAMVTPGTAGGQCRGGSPESAVHQIAFAIDTTSSMGPYIDGVKRISERWASEITRRGLTDKVRFGVVAYRNNMDEEPQRSGLEYVTRTILPLSATSDVNAFSAAMRQVRPATVSTHSFDEDAVAGLDGGLKLNWSQGCGVRMLFLITDAGSLKSDDPKASIRGTGLTTIAASAKEQGISIFPVHVLTPEARAAGDIEKAEQQYRSDLTDGRGTILYRSIPNGSTQAFGAYLQQVSAILDAIDDEKRGKLVDRPTVAAVDDGPPSVKDLVLGKLFAVQQRFLGAAAGATAPTFNASWTSDRDLTNPDIAALDVSIMLSRRQLGQLAEKCQMLIANARQAKTESGRFFDLLRMLSAATAQDPGRFANGSADLSALMPSFLSLLPYKSDVLSLTPQDWRGMGATKQDAFVRRVSEKLAFYRRIETDQSAWIQLSGSDVSDQVALIPLKEMP